MTRCPNCQNLAEPFDRGSDWCEACVRATLDEQERLRFAPEYPDVIALDRSSPKS